MPLVDSHCHLDMSEFREYFRDKYPDDIAYNDLYRADAIVDRAKEAGVGYLLTIGTNLQSVAKSVAIVDKFTNVFRTVGFHPDYAAEYLEEFSDGELREILSRQCNHEKTVGIGEIGLDYSKNGNDKQEQHRFFHLQLEIAEKFALPVSIHSRDAAEDTIAVLSDHPGLSGVIHCFSGERKFADAALNLGFYIAVGGTVTFKKNDILRETLQTIPLVSLLLETDAPFLAPMPLRGKINEPAYIRYTAEFISNFLNISFEELGNRTTQNFFSLFPKAAR